MIDSTHYRRLLQAPAMSFFLFGPRGIGKSSWLRTVLPSAQYFDLLNPSTELKLSRDPHLLEASIAPSSKKGWIVIDEIQKVPTLLSEVHRLMETTKHRFVLCGSSARKLRRGGADLLAGRAITVNMEALSFAEMGRHFHLQSILDWGTLPMVCRNLTTAANVLEAYVHTYIREEIKEEGIVRQVPPFLRFLSVAGLLNGQVVNASNIAREAALARSTVDQYFSILVDTLLGHFLPVYQPALKLRERAHPKFYWFDSGVARAASGLLRDPVDRLWKGWALETLLFHELRVFNETQEKHRPISYYKTVGGAEIDFVIETRKRRSSAPPHVVCVEAKLAERWERSWDRPMRDLKLLPGIQVDRMIGVYTGTDRYHFDGVDILPVADFL